MKHLNPQRLQQHIDAIARYDLDNRKVFGSAYLIVQEGGVTLERCYGTAGPAREAVSPRTLFRLASMTKPITAAMMLLLEKQELLSLDDPVEKHLPFFRDIPVIDAEGVHHGVPARKPTLRDVLNHCSGIGSDGRKTARITPAEKHSLAGTLAFTARSGLDYAPATAQMYGGAGAFDTLTATVEAVCGKDFSAVVRELLLTPCGMTDTAYVPTEEQWGRLADLHRRTDGESDLCRLPAGCVFSDYPCTRYHSGAGMVSTLTDYGRFAGMLLNGGDIDGRRVMSAESVRQMHTVHTPLEVLPEREHWGLGVRVITGDGDPYLPIGVYGWSGAYGTHFWVDPVNRLYAILMKNSTCDGGSGNESARKLEEAVYTALE